MKEAEEWREQGLQTLEELVLDAGEAVTYRRLASTLCLHVNKSKILLRDFAEKHPDLSVSFLVCGSTGGGNARAVICQRDELKDVKESLVSVLFEHIYAISRSKSALEGTALVNVAGGFDDVTPTIGAISSKVCIKYSQDEIGDLKLNIYKTSTESTGSTSKVAPKGNMLKQSSTINKAEKEKHKEPNTSENSTVIKKESEHNIISNDTKQAAKGQARSISKFFSKTNGQHAAKTTTKIKNDPRDIEQKVGKLSPLKEEKKKSINDKFPPNSKKELNKSDKSEYRKVSFKNKEIITAQRNCKIDKNRKRVLQVSDSEDSDEKTNDPFEDEKPQDVNMESDEDVIPPTPNTDVVKITSGIINPKKRRRIVDKTYTTDDGYMVTRKEEVIESCSDDEVEMKENIVETNVRKEIVVEKKLPPPTPKSKSKKKIASPQKGKQASIMTFFQKK